MWQDKVDFPVYTHQYTHMHPSTNHITSSFVTTSLPYYISRYIFTLYKDTTSLSLAPGCHIIDRVNMNIMSPPARAWPSECHITHRPLI